MINKSNYRKIRSLLEEKITLENKLCTSFSLQDFEGISLKILQKMCKELGFDKRFLLWEDKNRIIVEREVYNISETLRNYRKTGQKIETGLLSGFFGPGGVRNIIPPNAIKKDTKVFYLDFESINCPDSWTRRTRHYSSVYIPNVRKYICEEELAKYNKRKVGGGSTFINKQNVLFVNL